MYSLLFSSAPSSPLTCTCGDFCAVVRADHQLLWLLRQYSLFSAASRVRMVNHFSTRPRGRKLKASSTRFCKAIAPICRSCRTILFARIAGALRQWTNTAFRCSIATAARTLPRTCTNRSSRRMGLGTLACKWCVCCVRACLVRATRTCLPRRCTVACDWCRIFFTCCSQADALLADFRHRFNQHMSQRRRLGFPVIGASCRTVCMCVSVCLSSAATVVNLHLLQLITHVLSFVYPTRRPLQHLAD